MPSRGGAPSSKVAASRAADFNQPSVWQWLQAKVRSPLRSPPFMAGSSPSSPGLPRVPEGMSALARAQTYYHRPGNWAEHPNFFNPYWRSRLAPVVQGLQGTPWGAELLEDLPGTLRRAPQQFVTH